MKLVELELKDLITPDQFELTSEDELFDSFVTAVNNELENAVNSENEIFATADANVEVILNADDDFSVEVTSQMVAALNSLYQQIGWREVTYEHQEETDDNYESHVFKFYFKSDSSIPGLSL